MIRVRSWFPFEILLAFMVLAFAACSSPRQDGIDDRVEIDDCEEEGDACLGSVKGSRKQVVVVKGEEDKRAYYEIEKVNWSRGQQGLREREVLLLKLDDKTLRGDPDVPRIKARVFEEWYGDRTIPTGKTLEGYRSKRKLINLELEDE